MGTESSETLIDFVTYAGVLLGAAVLSGVAVWVSIGVSRKFGVFDHPDGGRKSQIQPIPRLGGLAVALAFSASALVLLALPGQTLFIRLGLGILIPALVASVLGYADDLRNLNPLLRLGLQFGTGALAWATGTRIELTGSIVADFLLTALWFMVVVNGVNLLDNSDGLAVSTVLISAAGASVIALIHGQQFISLLGFALVGVCLGYLRFNWHPARVYMGDAGSYFLGFMLATLVIRLQPAAVFQFEGMLIALLLVALPLTDTLYVVIKRVRLGIHPFTAGRDHLSHVLQESGKSVRMSVLMLQVVTLVSAVAAISIAYFS